MAKKKPEPPAASWVSTQLEVLDDLQEQLRAGDAAPPGIRDEASETRGLLSAIATSLRDGDQDKAREGTERLFSQLSTGLLPAIETGPDPASTVRSLERMARLRFMLEGREYPAVALESIENIRPSTAGVTKRGRPKLELDLRQIEALRVIGSTYEEIALVMRCSADTIARRKKEDPNFCGALERGEALRKVSLRRMQTTLALRGNVAMLRWLGIQDLGQKHRIDATFTQERRTELVLPQSLSPEAHKLLVEHMRKEGTLPGIHTEEDLDDVN